MSLDFVDIDHRYGEAVALEGVRFSAEPGDITCLLGPSGCGKSTLLRLAAGILSVQQGEIRLDGEVLANRDISPPPEKRPVGLIFQEGALFPHMTVARNVEFGIDRRKDRASISSGLLGLVGLADYAQRYPHTLSGGQQQRVALARAMAPEPRVLLLDEPFANVDVVRRRALREETRRTLKSRDSIAVMVTHDPVEAMEIADRIAVMEQRRIVQIGTPKQLYDSPTTASVGALIGEGQVIKGRRVENGVETPFGTWSTACWSAPLPDASSLDLLVRPSTVRPVPDSAGAIAVEDVRCTGAEMRLAVVAPNGARLAVETSRDEVFAAGDRLTLEPKHGSVIVFAS